MTVNTDSLSQLNPNVSGTDTTTTRRVADAVHSAIDDTAERAEQVERELRERAAGAGEKVQQSTIAASEQLERSVAQAKSFAKERPLTAAGLAFAAGVLTTVLLRRQ